MTSNGRRSQNIKSRISTKPLIGSYSHFQLKLIYRVWLCSAQLVTEYFPYYPCHWISSQLSISLHIFPAIHVTEYFSYYPYHWILSAVIPRLFFSIGSCLIFQDAHVLCNHLPHVLCSHLPHVLCKSHQLMIIFDDFSPSMNLVTQFLSLPRFVILSFNL